MKLSPLTIILIGLSVAIIAVSYGYFHSYAPKSVEISQKETELDQLVTQNRQGERVKQRVEKAIADVREKGDQWAAVVATSTPGTNIHAGGINLAVNAYQLTVDSRIYRDSVQKAVNNQLKKGGVRVVSGLRVPDPPDDPDSIFGYYSYPTAGTPVVIFDLGATTVEGTYSQIMANVRSWASMPNYLAVASGLSLSGTSPRLTGTYNVTIVGFIKGKAIGPKAVSGQTASNQRGPRGG